MVRWLLIFSGVAATLVVRVAAQDRDIRVFIALCDNASQGIAPVPARIGDGNVPADNLYWGCDDGFGQVFKRSPHWKTTASESLATGDILEKRTLRHARANLTLEVAAYRGSAIRQCLMDFEKSLASGQHDLVAFIGHNGLMDFALELPAAPAGNPTMAMVLCCKSRQWFGPRVAALKATPLLMTEQFMYPGAFLLHDAIEAWQAGGDAAAVRAAAARAYAANQKISLRAALGVFSPSLE